MLEIFFCNVGDGDAAIIREFRDGTPVRAILVDCGRPYVESREGSLRKDALEYLLDRGVGHLDRIILTHPHIDHVGGALRILRAIPTNSLEMLTTPPSDAQRVSRSFTSIHKTGNSLRQSLNVLLELTEGAREKGTAVRSLRAGTQRISRDLAMTAYLPRKDVVLRQRRAFNALYRGVPAEESFCFRVAKERNVSSLMLRFTYAGRSALITGDRFASDWDSGEFPPCDILKLPHHGDRRSVTPALLDMLSPGYAVVSCENDPPARKERPSEDAIALLLARVPEVYCTENRALPGFDAATHNGIRFTIETDGTITCRTE